jgi:hypothetical protein
VYLKRGFFGTLAEARGIAALARKRGYQSLILITAPVLAMATTRSVWRDRKAGN